jgi:hypothetical protein
MIADVADQKASAATVAEYDQRIARNAREELY